jgi:hypothetical protein
MQDPQDPLTFKLSPSSGDYRGCIIRGLVTLFHDVLRDELTRLGVDNIQYFPVELEDSDGYVEEGYSLINVVGLIEAVDQGASVVEPTPGGERGLLKSFKIDPDKVKGQRLFRLVEAPTLIIIDEALHKKLLEFNPPGVMMLPTERYNGWS